MIVLFLGAKSFARIADLEWAFAALKDVSVACISVKSDYCVFLKNDVSIDFGVEVFCSLTFKDDVLEPGGLTESWLANLLLTYSVLFSLNWTSGDLELLPCTGSIRAVF